jgi:RHS repeat-associated protein
MRIESIYDSTSSFVHLGALAASRYTGKERDTESGLDYFEARYYGSSMGQFMTPDPGWFLQADLGNPQTLNQYAYVLNNPLGSVDPDGLADDPCYSRKDKNGIPIVVPCFQNPAPAPTPPPTPSPAPPDDADKIKDILRQAVVSDPAYKTEDALAGYADAFSLSTAKIARKAMGLDSQIDQSSAQYKVGAVTGAAVGFYVAGAKDGVLFGTRRGYALLNRSNTIRLGWSLRKATGVATWTFRIGGAVAATWAADPGHITLWLPSWW